MFDIDYQTSEYLTELNVIRFWNDEIIEKLKKDLELPKIEYKE